MPLAKPHKGESRSTFLQRCYGDSNTRKEFGNDNDQIGGYCYTAWKEHKTKASLVVQAANDEWVVKSRKEPIDSDIEKQKKTASNPPKDQVDINNGGPTSCPNPNPPTAPSPDLPMRGSPNNKGEGPKGIDSWDQGKKPDLDDMQWMLGKRVRKIGQIWTFEEIERDFKRPNKDPIQQQTKHDPKM